MSDFQSLLESLTNAFKEKLPFVAYRKPNETNIKALIQSNRKLHYSDDFQTAGFIFAPFDYKNNAILIPSTASKILLASSPEETIDDTERLITKASTVEKDNYVELVNHTISFIKEGHAIKIVTSRKEEIETSNFSFGLTFERLLNSYKNTFVYVWFHPSIGLWLGATPERLLSVQGKSFKTVSLAGTQAYGSQNSIWGDKEINEQKIVTNYITAKLSSITSTISVVGPETVQAGNLFHLKTRIEGTLKETNSINLLVNLLHPTPAICGMPEDIAKQFILDNEPYDREYYTGFLGEINSGNVLDLFVNLRCMKVENSKMTLYLGGGITHDSNSIDEWTETVSKSKIIKNVL